MEKTDVTKILKVFGSIIPLHRSLLEAFGLEDGVWLSYMFDKWRWFLTKGWIDKDGWFWREQKKITKETGISLKRQQSTCKRLKALEVLEVERRGIPPKNHYRVDWEKVMDIVDQSISDEIKDEEDFKSVKGPLWIGQRATLDRSNGRVSNVLIGNNEETRGDIGKANAFPTSDKSEVKGTAEAVPLSSTVSNPSGQRKSPVKHTSPMQKKTPAPRIATFNQGLFDYWISLGLHPYTPRAEKSINAADKKLTQLRRGTLFKATTDEYVKYDGRCFTDDEIKLAMDNFKLVALDPSYKPRGKTNFAKMTLSDFLWHLHFNKSFFIQFLFEQPIPLEQDEYPRFTQMLKRWYTEEFVGGLRGIPLSVGDENKIIAGAKAVVTLYEKNKEQFGYLSSGGIADLFLEFLREQKWSSGFNPVHNLASAVLRSFGGWLHTKENIVDRGVYHAEENEPQTPAWQIQLEIERDRREAEEHQRDLR